MKSYNLPIQNLDLVQSLHQSSKCPDELNYGGSITATWFKLSELHQLPQETQDFFIALRTILTKPNVCIIATKSSDFVLSYVVHQQFYTVKDFNLFNLADEQVSILDKEIYVTPLAIPDFIVQDVLNA